MFINFIRIYLVIMKILNCPIIRFVIPFGNIKKIVFLLVIIVLIAISYIATVV